MLPFTAIIPPAPPYEYPASGAFLTPAAFRGGLPRFASEALRMNIYREAFDIYASKGAERA